ncbi:MAG TPA: DUF1131 family protein, partial [Hyphomicrobiales bacterium]|nr:DUF1131 family protein [Hyphomicrobiales bacterium]
MIAFRNIAFVVAAGFFAGPALASDFSPTAHDVEDAYWEMIRDAGAASAFEGYISAYPQGRHVESARLLKAVLGAGPAGPLPVVAPCAMAATARTEGAVAGELATLEAACATSKGDRVAAACLEQRLAAGDDLDPAEADALARACEAGKARLAEDLAALPQPRSEPSAAAAPDAATAGVPAPVVVADNGAAAPGEAEVAFWKAVADSNDASLYEAYLQRFPNGFFAVIAEARLKALAAPAPATPAAPADATPTPATPAADTPAAAPMPAPRPVDAKALYDAGQAAELRGDQEAAAGYYQQAAEAGSADAYHQLGYFHDQGIVFARDPRLAEQAFVNAARLGKVFAYWDLQSFYEVGREPEVAVDYDKAADLLLDLAVLDIDNVLYSLGQHPAETIAAAQRKLAAAGFYGSTVDGKVGPGTRQALTDYGASGAGPKALGGAAVVAAAAPAADAAAAGAAGGLVLSRDGIGGLTAATAFEPDAVGKALPGFTIRTRRESAEGMSWLVIELLDGGKVAMVVDGSEGRISSVEVEKAGIAV